MKSRFHFIVQLIIISSIDKWLFLVRFLAYTLFMDKLPEEKRFSIIARARSFKYAFRGIRVIVATQHNSWIHLVVGAVVVLLGLWLKVSPIEWCMLIFAISGVLITEAINTAIEFDVDLSSPEYHPYAKDSKDVAAGAVLIAGVAAAIVGLLIFVPKITNLFL